LNDALASLGVNLTYAKLKVPESVTENPNAQLDGENHAYEEYYITLQTPSTATNVYTSNVLVSDRSSDTMGDMYKPDGVEEKTVLPTLYQKTESTENTTYIIGNIYNQTIEIDGKGSELVDEDTEYIDADITATISANDTFKKFIENNQNVQISHGLDFDLILYQDDTGTATQTVEQFDANTSVQLLNYKINGTETVKSADPTAASSSLVEFNNIVEDLKSTITSNNEVTVTATVRINIGDIDEQFKNAYRDSSLDSTAGIAIRVTSKLGSENSYFKASDKTAQHYYVEKQKSASLSYNAAKDASFGGTTALGINPYELELDGDQSAAIIDSTAVYNLSDVTDKLESFSNDNLAVRYTLTLKQKQDSSAYIGVNIDDYLSDITLDNEEMTYDKDTTSYYITRKWSNDKTVDSFSVQFAVKTGVNEFEAQKMLYSNYEVVLDAQIYSYDSDINTPDTTVEGTAVSDYIIYTNARILLDLYQKQSNE
jgi:hypothetical protein